MNAVFQLIRFGCVGAVASLVHLCVVSALVALGCSPAWANPAAFLMAFQASYHGHRSWTFGGETSRPAWGKLFLTSLSGFGINHAAFLVLLRFVPLDCRLLLVLVLLLQAAGNFIAMRCWVFRRG